ncbi:MAG: hypothetical protein EON59_06600 [Alphaproteobacteria bacterium]|nr:MAG: hypothetical protein EON59_06600 [Alphaproteobacteria bacterium]
MHRYLLIRGSVHAHSYALALKKLTGVNGGLQSVAAGITPGLRACQGAHKGRIVPCSFRENSPHQ